MFNKDSLLSLLVDNQNRILRCTGVRRTLQGRLVASFGSKPIKIVTGFRRSGKSWLCMHVVKDLVESKAYALENVFYLNFEDYRLGA